MSRAYFASTCLCVLLIFGSAAFHASAAALAPLDSSEFWSSLQQTAVDLDLAIADSTQSSSTLAKIEARWQAVDAVRFANGDVVAVDLTWLAQGLQSKSLDELKTVRRQVQGLLSYHDKHPDDPQELASALAALDDVLKDPRFHYAATPTPQIAPTSSQTDQQPDSPDTQLISPEVAQILLLVVGVLVVSVLLVSFARNLRIQQRQLSESLPENEPTTSQEARERAVDSEGAQDYRTAMRYLYLSSLLLLDERGVLHYDRALTNREHLRQVGGQPELSAALRPVVDTFDRVWYGFAPVDEPMFDTFRVDVERLRQITP